MASLLRALRFLTATTLRPPSDEPGEPVALTLAEGWQGEGDLYRPDGTAGGLIVFFHGMSEAGYRDARMCRAARALAAAGFFVLVPRVRSLEALALDFDAPVELARALRAAHQQHGWTGGRRVAVFSVSYSAALAMLACMDPEVQPLVSVVCGLGSCSDLARWGRHLVTEPSVDEYGRLILLRNYLGEVVGTPPEVDEGLLVAIRDNWAKRDPPEFSAFLAGLAPETAELLRGLKEDPAVWQALGKRVVDARYDAFHAMNVEARADRLRCPVVLVHGEHDAVIPSTESRSLHAAIQRQGGASRLVVTPLLDHGEVAPGVRAVGDAFRVIGAFAAFFAEASRG